MESVDSEIYLDNNATTQVLPEACVAMMEAMGSGFGNPSSSHRAGEKSRRALFAAKQSIAKLVGCLPENLIFGSGTTELNNLILRGICSESGSHLVTTTVEHSSVLRVAEKIEAENGSVSYLSVDEGGLIDPEKLRKSFTDRTKLVSIQWVNGETGVVQNVEEIASLCVSAGVKFHCDAAQAIGKTAISVGDLPVDFLTFSAHKLHGPAGVGAVYCRSFSGLRPLLVGGPQENGLRAGTENIPGIIGFGAAAESRVTSFAAINARICKLRDRFESLILARVDCSRLNGTVDSRIGNTTNICFQGIDGQALVANLDQRGVRCSQTSACSSQTPEPSHVLTAMRLSEQDAYSSVRFSFSDFNTLEEIDRAVEHVTKRVTELRQSILKSYV